MIRWLMNNEFERIYREAIVACFKVQYRSLPELSEENHENLQAVFSELRV
jgi:hypothetical protein